MYIRQDGFIFLDLTFTNFPRCGTNRAILYFTYNAKTFFSAKMEKGAVS